MPAEKNKRKRIRVTPVRIIAAGFALLVLLGAVLLTLPAASKDNVATPFEDAFFTSASATCVTGLVIYDTATHWSVFGQIVIICLIQIGGLGFVTVLSLFMFIARGNITFGERRLLMESAGALSPGEINSLVTRILVGTAVAELAGTALFAFRFIPQLGIGKGLYYSAFHSVSAFCNAGFDLMGTESGQFSSLTAYVSDPLVTLTTCALIITGGIGFLVWTDFSRFKFKLRRYSLHSKLVLASTAFLILSGWVLFFFSEANASMKGLTLPERALASLFQSVTTRTAGMNSVDQSALSGTGNALTMILMLIGGSPGSTAGGIKTTTIAVLVLNAAASVRNFGSVNVFKRRIDDSYIKRAASIVTVYLIVVFALTSLISFIEGVPFTGVLYEMISAIGTVGLSKGIIPGFATVSKIIIALVMFMGRVGGLSLALAFFQNRQPTELERPSEKFLIG